VVPNVHPVDAELVNSYENRADIIFIGNFNHPPNSDGIVWFAKQVWPIVKSQLSDVKLHIVGPNPPGAVTELRRDDILVHGWVKDVRMLLDAARVSVAPLRYGAGMKGKIGEAMSRGVPVITTPIGAEGMPAVSGSDLEVCDDPEKMASCIVSIYTNPEKWHKLSENGRRLVREQYGVDAVTKMLSALLSH
jgi:glycosyltransferase involved in cell wall biosynthesis